MWRYLGRLHLNVSSCYGYINNKHFVLENVRNAQILNSGIKGVNNPFIISDCGNVQIDNMQ